MRHSWLRRQIGNGDRLAERVRVGESGCHCDAGPAGTGRSDGCDGAGLLVRFVIDENGLARGKARDVAHLDVGGTHGRGGDQSGGRLDEPRAVPLGQGRRRRHDLLAVGVTGVGRTGWWIRVVGPRQD